MKAATAAILASLLLAGTAAAETLYVTDRLDVGLHEEKMLDSPIIKTVPTGTALELIKREDDASFVRAPDGASGWIDNSYLVGDNPATSPGQEAENRIRELEQQLQDANKQIRTLKAQAPREAPEPPPDVKELQDRNSDLQDRLKEEKLKTGELQVQLAELRKRLGMDNEKESLYKEIENLTQKNKELEVQLARARDRSDAEIRQQALAAKARPGKGGWQRLLVYLGVSLLVGLVLGIYLMDVFNRRRHGGFRV